MKFRLATSIKMEKELRNVAMSAMEQTGIVKCEMPIGMRVHLQFALPKNEEKRIAARAGTVAPPELGFNIGRTFTNACKGIVFPSAEQVIQLLITKAWGEIDGVSVTCWEVDRAGVGK